MSPDPINFGDVQGLVRFGYRRLTEASFLLMTIKDAEAARRWLRNAPVADAIERDAAPLTALQVALTRDGLERLGVSAEMMRQFSAEFLSGISGDESRSRLLGDVGASSPSEWQWGGPGRVPHLLAMFYAQPGQLAAWMAQVTGADWDAAFGPLASLETTDLGGFEPFGFTDGVSQPEVDWSRTRVTKGDQLTHNNVVSLGEFLLGYRNEYGRFTDRPLLARDSPGSEAFSPAEDAPERRDLGRNGCYLVLRTLEQDVRGFWSFVDAKTGVQGDESHLAARERLAEAMVGRRRNGEPLVPLSAEIIPGIDPGDAALNQFTFDEDPDGVLCPFGAHVRRANPRNTDLPTAGVRGLRRLLETFGLGSRDLRSDAKASARFHRILRRGREYGPKLPTEEALGSGVDKGLHGIHFVCLVANIARQFEFLQSAWMMSTKFDAMTEESDPLLGNRQLVAGCPFTDTFSLPREGGLRDRISGVPQFVTVRGGAYFFLPSPERTSLLRRSRG